MAAVIGTTAVHSIESLLGNTNQSVHEFGLDNIQASIAQDLTQFNAQMTEMISSMAEPLTDIQRVMGASTGVTSQEVDEYGKGTSIKDTKSSQVAWVLRRFVYNSTWTDRALTLSSPSDIAMDVGTIQTEHYINLITTMKQAIFSNVNATLPTRFSKPVADVVVRRWWNADSQPMPRNPQSGATFNGATHQHYTAAAALNVADILALGSNVSEHSINADIQIYIHEDDVAAFTALTGFNLAVVEDIDVMASDVPFTRRNRGETSNFFLGTLGVNRIYVKPWAIPNYAVAIDNGASTQKSLGFRQDVNGQQLTQIGQVDIPPYTTQNFQTYFGWGALNRGAGAVHQFDNATYVIPTI